MKPEDEKYLKEIKQKIAHALSDVAAGRYDQTWELSALQYCVSIIEDFKDENDSLWFMLEEYKNAQWSKEHTVELEKVINDQMTILQLMQMKIGEA